MEGLHTSSLHHQQSVFSVFVQVGPTEQPLRHWWHCRALPGHTATPLHKLCYGSHTALARGGHKLGRGCYCLLLPVLGKLIYSQPICRSRGTPRRPAGSYSQEHTGKGKQGLDEGQSPSNTALFASRLKFKQLWLRAGPATSATQWHQLRHLQPAWPWAPHADVTVMTQGHHSDA